MQYLEENYISAIVVVRNDEMIVADKVNAIYGFLRNNFKHFEIVLVDNYSKDGTPARIDALSLPVTMIRLAKRHSVQQALTAGAEIAMGDYLVEIPDIAVDYDEANILSLYQTCLEGNDFVFHTPARISRLSNFFYKMLNAYFKDGFPIPLNASIITFSSRRGQNKTADIGNQVVNRSISYMLTGLKCASVPCDVSYNNRRDVFENINLMIDSFIYYTDYIMRIAIGVSLLFFLCSLIGVVYGVVSYLSRLAVSGWTSAFILNSAAFCAIFLILAVMCKYLSHVLLNASEAKPYIFQSVVKKERSDDL